MKNKKIFLTTFFLLIISIFAGGFLSSVRINSVEADTNLPGCSGVLTGRLGGYAWSDTIGWIHLGENQGEYGIGVKKSATDNAISRELCGYVWSDNIGWITFDSTKLTGCPDGTCTAQIDSNQNLSGWARACAGSIDGGCGTVSRTDGWDGWISLAGKTIDGKSSYGVKSGTNNHLLGYAWGGSIVGWIDFMNTTTNNPGGSCGNNEARDDNGDCCAGDKIIPSDTGSYCAACGEGLVNNNGQCVCPEGAELVNGECVRVCPDGQEVVGNGCANIVICGAGQEKVGNNCVDIPVGGGGTTGGGTTGGTTGGATTKSCLGSAPTGYVRILSDKLPISATDKNWTFVPVSTSDVDLKACDWTCKPADTTYTYSRAGSKCVRNSIIID
ncbi:MAG: hypothetical protein WCF94_00620 [bacterium]